MLNVTCSHCGAQLKVPEQYAGQQGGCSFCGGRFTVPTAEELASRRPAPVFVAVDCETTGLYPEEANITELAAVVFRPEGTVLDAFSSLANPGHPIPPFITAMTGITDKMVRKAPPSTEVARNWLKWVPKNSILFAHNASFDVRFLSATLAESALSLHGARFVDTLGWVRRHPLPTLDNKLPTLLEHIGFDTANAHRALEDAKGVAALTVYLLAKYEQAQTLRDAHEVVGALVRLVGADGRLLPGKGSRKRTAAPPKARRKRPSKEDTELAGSSVSRRLPGVCLTGFAEDEEFLLESMASRCGYRVARSVTQTCLVVVLGKNPDSRIVRTAEERGVLTVDFRRFMDRALSMIDSGQTAVRVVRCPLCKEYMYIPREYEADKGRCFKCGNVLNFREP